ncbi:dnaJ homolog subfamily C member 11 isoform X1 [Tribolium castaneum]|uniref:DnaJ homolog subfamily C member 11-like Protein n=1 Tax=Tribolium castaneum TaxID=7070 RepID=D6WKU6_TRICA|nr:PREDICTED: dnaJ homolog subfamily C member 11 isoform X1 [Tribolium castaneum]EFA04019.2 DnaJ homolog subfamily C member 11-like Protein [Tribolium castaneum]|eukprot:XP_008193614.1 PREDICTED: dnaJ homolog subfamily C member 11 isoform X1 [Tribolium castaneum]
MDLDSDDENVIEEDFYSFLNVPKEATKEEINNAYRRLSRMYHPDKHVDPELKTKAEILFNKTKKAYEVLSDPHRRAIYDSLGMKGLETEGWEIVQRTKTPAEIRAEYEQLAEERAERRKQQRTNPNGNITVAINATDLFNPYEDEIFEDDFEPDLLQRFPNIEVSSMQFSQSVDFPLTQKDTCTLSGQLQAQNGTGGGAVNLSWRHIYSHKSWAEVEMAAGSGPSVSFKGFRTLSKRFFWNGGTILQFTPEGIRPGIMSTLAMQIDKHSVGYLTYHGGIRSFVSTSIVRDTEFNHYNLSIQVGLPHSYVSLNYTRKMLNQELKLRISIKAGTFGGVVEYGAEKKVSKHSNLSFAVTVGVPSGVKLKIRLTRANQVYNFPIHLCEEIMPSPVFYATVVPLIVYVVVKKGFVEPFLKEQKAKKVEKQKQNNFNKLLEKRREALAAQDLMKATYARIRDEEENKKGLVVIKAIYGKISTDPNEVGDHEVTNEIIDVTIPIQCTVKDSKLVLHENTKSQLPGFFDPAIGEDKMLHIIYNYREQPHEVTIKDNESLRLPKTSHRTNVT